jgi:hypothetical protein
MSPLIPPHRLSGLRSIMRRAAIGCVILMALASVVAFVSLQKATLRRYREVIESAYASEITLIEQRARELPDPDDWSRESMNRIDAIDGELRAALSKPEVFSASWSLDGHHGLRSIKPMDTDGYSTYSNWFGSRDARGLHSLSYGTTFQGEELLVYQGWVLEGVNRSYTIAFYRSAMSRLDQR